MIIEESALLPQCADGIDSCAHLDRQNPSDVSQPSPQTNTGLPEVVNPFSSDALGAVVTSVRAPLTAVTAAECSHLRPSNALATKMSRAAPDMVQS